MSKPQKPCRCDCAYIGTQLAGTPTRCERCGGLVDDVAAERMEAAYEESRQRLMGRCQLFLPPRRCCLTAGHDGTCVVDPTEPAWIGGGVA